MTVDKMRHYINNDSIFELIGALGEDGLRKRLKALDARLRFCYPNGAQTYPIHLVAERNLMKYRLGIK